MRQPRFACMGLDGAFLQHLPLRAPTTLDDCLWNVSQSNLALESTVNIALSYSTKLRVNVVGLANNNIKNHFINYFSYK